MPEKLVEHTYGTHIYMKMRLNNKRIEEIDVYLRNDGQHYITSADHGMDLCQQKSWTDISELTVKKEKEKKMLKAVEIKWDVTDYNDDEFDDEACEVLESLPTEMDIPEGMTDPDEISDWLSDETGFCHDGFRIIDKNGNDVNLA